MPVDPFHVQRLCADLGGVARANELDAGGVSRHAIATAVRARAIIRLREGVYVHADTSADVRTAVMHGGSVGCLSRAKEVGLWILEKPTTLHAALPTHGHLRQVAHDPGGDEEDDAADDACACILHWCRGGARGGLQALPDALAALLVCMGEEHFFVALESAMRKRLIDTAGCARLRAAIPRKDRWLVDFARWNADSGLESLLRLRLRPLGISLASQVKIPGVGSVDFVLGDRLIIEVDGKPNHDGPNERHKDLARDVAAAAQGFDTLRFDSALVIHDWEMVEAAILTKLELGLHRRVRVGG
ncbi:DUF559 domain-containing protein [Agromyces sp. NPDC058484]|uniref:DUF559 domain-containing protein n=1 Tax=Agromyces sp. NPDC058484 TaxID=3346524 RepID=UPI0036636CDE